MCLTVKRIVEMKVKISERALMGRINRKLNHEYKAVRKTRPNSMERMNLGEYYLLDTYRNIVEAFNVKLDNIARDLGVMAEYEELAEL
jgi:hypothetical protein